MKRIIYSIIAMLGLSTSAMSQNALTVDDILLPQSGEATLTVNFLFDAADTYASYQFNLELPSDLEFVMKDGSETDAVVVKGSCNEGYTVTANLNEGLLKVAGLSGGDALKGTSGIFLQFTIKPKTSGLSIGQEYNCAIKDIVFATIGGDEVKFADSNFKVTITQYTILDETSTVAPTAKSDVDVLVKRTIKANEWSTICLPFAMSEVQVKAAFGDDVQLGDFSSWNSEEDGDGAIVAISVGFTTVSAIEANHPYVINVSSAITEFTVDGVDIEAEEKPTIQVGKKSSERGYFYGTYVANTLIPEENLFLNNNSFWYSTGKTKTKAFRGYFEFKDVLDSYYDVASAPQITMVFDGNETTGIEGLKHNAPDTGIMYDLQGRRIETLSKGLYIKNGKKVVVK